MDLPTQNGIGTELVAGVESIYPYSRRTLLTRLSIDGSVVDQ